MDTMKERMRSFFITDSSFRNQQTLLDCNFKLNIRALETREDVSMRVEHDIWKYFYGRDIYIIAAGPSLDKNLELLRDRPKNAVLISTGTTFHKMLSLGIRPDYVMVTDPNDRVIFQLRDNEAETIPMILLSTANRQFVQKYHGKKYLIFQNEYRPAEEYALKNDMTLCLKRADRSRQQHWIFQFGQKREGSFSLGSILPLPIIWHMRLILEYDSDR